MKLKIIGYYKCYYCDYEWKIARKFYKDLSKKQLCPTCSSKLTKRIYVVQERSNEK